MKLSVIVTAGGSSVRYGKDKLLEKINGKTVIEHSVYAFLPLNPYEIIISASEKLENEIKDKFSGIENLRIVQGGKTRQESVFNALKSCSAPDFVCIHDAARPLIKQEHIKNCLEKAIEKGAAITAVKATDTIKKVDNLLSNLDTTKPVVVICPATTWRLKHWDKDNWKEVVKYLENKCSLIFSGTEKDKDLLSYIGGDNHINLAGKTNVKDLIEIFKRADLVMAPDSGSAHVAWATGKPAVISIFTCTPPSLYGAYGNKDKYFAVNGNLECQPCFTKSCPKLKDKDKCLKHPTPQEIINIVNKVFNFAENVV